MAEAYENLCKGEAVRMSDMRGQRISAMSWPNAAASEFRKAYLFLEQGALFCLAVQQRTQPLGIVLLRRARLIKAHDLRLAHLVRLPVAPAERLQQRVIVDRLSALPWSSCQEDTPLKTYKESGRSMRLLPDQEGSIYIDTSHCGIVASKYNNVALEHSPSKSLTARQARPSTRTKPDKFALQRTRRAVHDEHHLADVLQQVLRLHGNRHTSLHTSATYPLQCHDVFCHIIGDFPNLVQLIKRITNFIMAPQEGSLCAMLNARDSSSRKDNKCHPNTSAIQGQQHTCSAPCSCTMAVPRLVSVAGSTTVLAFPPAPHCVKTSRRISCFSSAFRPRLFRNSQALSCTGGGPGTLFSPCTSLSVACSMRISLWSGGLTDMKGTGNMSARCGFSAAER